jgi:NADPH-dependent 7-cyano-7-deazaguanine reductase QueF
MTLWIDYLECCFILALPDWAVVVLSYLPL